MNNTKKLVILALLTSIGIILGMIENLIPFPVKIPGAKLGLSNVIQLLVIVVIGYREGVIVAALKTLLIAIGTGNAASILYSMPAAISSTVIMILAYRCFKDKFSLIGISILGALAHNFMQLLVAFAVVGNKSIFIYYPFLAMISLITGYIIGIIALQFVKYMKNVSLKI